MELSTRKLPTDGTPRKGDLLSCLQKGVFVEEKIWKQIPGAEKAANKKSLVVENHNILTYILNTVIGLLVGGLVSTHLKNMLVKLGSSSPK